MEVSWTTTASVSPDSKVLVELAKLFLLWQINCLDPSHLIAIVGEEQRSFLDLFNGKHADADGFTSDTNDAVRFARREDSERVIYWLMEKYKVFLVSRQHKWLEK